MHTLRDFIPCFSSDDAFSQVTEVRGVFHKELEEGPSGKGLVFAIGNVRWQKPVLGKSGEGGKKQKFNLSIFRFESINPECKPRPPPQQRIRMQTPPPPNKELELKIPRHLKRPSKSSEIHPSKTLEYHQTVESLFSKFTKTGPQKVFSETKKYVLRNWSCSTSFETREKAE